MHVLNDISGLRGIAKKFRISFRTDTEQNLYTMQKMSFTTLTH